MKRKNSQKKCDASVNPNFFFLNGVTNWLLNIKRMNNNSDWVE